MPISYYFSLENNFGPGEAGGETPTNPDLPIDPENPKVLGIFFGTSKEGDAVGFHGSRKDGYGEGDAILGGLKVYQLRALGDSIRLRFDKDKAPQEIVYAKLRGITVEFIREEGQPRYNAINAEAAKLFVDGHVFRVEDGEAPEGEAPGTDVDTLTPGLDEVEDGGNTIEPPKETKPAIKKRRAKK